MCAAYRLFFRKHSAFVIKRNLSSALYITGDKANNNFAALTPHLDFEERLQDKSQLLENIRLRQQNIDIEQVEKFWKFYKHLDDQRVILECTKTAISSEISRLMKEQEKNQNEISKLKLHAKLTKEEHKDLRNYLYSVEEAAALKVLSLPNVLDQRAPHEHEVVVYSFGERPTQKAKFHFDIAVRDDLIEYVNPMCIFLKGGAALFELSTIGYFHDVLLDCSFTQFSNASFVRSLIVEGCGTNFSDASEVFTLENDDSQDRLNRLHLVGGATLYSFMAYFTKFSIQKSLLPMKLFASGKRYKPVESQDRNLFNLEQNSALEIFIAVIDDEEALNNEFKNVVSDAVKLYEKLGYHFQMVYLPIHRLQNYESLRLSIQMWSAYSGEYVEIGHISLCDNYLSKRLLVTYRDNKERKYPKIISGTLLNVQKLLACVLEYNDTSNGVLMSNLLKQYTSL